MKLYKLFQNSILSFEPLIEPYLVEPPRGTIAERVAIYANGFYGRLEETLQNDYECVARLLGEEAFEKLARSYVEKYPSFHYSLNNFGENLEQFLKETKPYQHEPYLAEIAAFECAEDQAITAADGKLDTIADLEKLPLDEWPNKIFHLHPSARLLSMQWSSFTIIEALRKDEPIPKVKRLKSEQKILVWRHQREIRYGKLTDLDYLLISAIQDKATFLELCERLSQKMPESEVPTYLVQELHAWLNEEIFVKEDPA